MPGSSKTPSSRLTLEDVPSIETIREDWSRLAYESGTIFLTPEWASLWWRHFGHGRKLCLKACRDERGRLIAILPLYLWNRRLSVLRFIGHGPGDVTGPVVAPADRERAASCLLPALEQEGGHLLLAELLPGDSDWQDWLPGARVLTRNANPVLDLHRFETWDDYLLSRSRSSRRQAHRQRSLAQRFEMRFRLSTRESLAEDLELLFSLHRARWSPQATEFAGRDMAFQRDFIVEAEKQGWLRLRFLEFDDRAVAVWLGYRYAGAEHGYQSGRDPACRDLSVGSILRQHAMESAFDDSVREYRFLRGGETYKYRFSNRDEGLLTLAVPRDSLGSALAFVAARLIGARKMLRRSAEQS